MYIYFDRTEQEEFTAPVSSPRSRVAGIPRLHLSDRRQKNNILKDPQTEAKVRDYQAQLLERHKMRQRGIRLFMFLLFFSCLLLKNLCIAVKLCAYVVYKN